MKNIVVRILIATCCLFTVIAVAQQSTQTLSIVNKESNGDLNIRRIADLPSSSNSQSPPTLIFSEMSFQVLTTQTLIANPIEVSLAGNTNPYNPTNGKVMLRVSDPRNNTLFYVSIQPHIPGAKISALTRVPFTGGEVTDTERQVRSTSITLPNEEPKLDPAWENIR